MDRHVPFAFAWPRSLAAILFASFTLLASSVHAQLCANPGKDGPATAITGTVNTYYPGTASATAGATSIPLGTSSGAATPIAAGDLLLVIQMQDAVINSANSSSYGDGVAGGAASGVTALNSAGLYEFVVATGPVSGGAVPILGAGAGGGLVNAYNNAAATGTQGQRRFQVIRVPQYSSASLGAALTCLPWSGAVGGVLVIDVAGDVNLNGATVDLSGRGFRGGGGRAVAGQTGGANTDFRSAAANNYHGEKGEGIAGTPRYLLDPIGGTLVDTGIDGYPNGSSARGAPGNAGGGGTDGHPSANDQNSGGGGGGNGGTGGGGGNTWSSNLVEGGYGGVFSPALNRIVMGGGGGAGSRNNSAGVTSSGGAGGGIAILRAGSLSGSGSIVTDGVTGPAPANDGGGGGGAGGTVVAFVANNSLAGLSVFARGAAGTNTDLGGTPHGPGGGGGGGYVASNAAVTATVSGGVAGTTVDGVNNYNATAGTAGVTSTALVAASMPGQQPTALCLPSLAVTKTTSTPAITNTGTGTTAAYSIQVVNNGPGDVTAVSVADSLPSGFTYASTGSVSLAGGASRPTATGPAVGDSVLSFASFDIPAGGSVTITTTVNVASRVAPATYQNSASASYLDPARTTVAGTASARYNQAASSGEDVTVRVVDLSIDKRHTSAFTAGSNGLYTLVVRNLGTAASSGTITVRDTLPAGLTFVSGTGTGWAISNAAQIVTATNAGPIAAGDSASFTLTVAVGAGAAPSVTNSATVSGGGDFSPANDRDSDPTSVAAGVDLTIDKRHTAAFSVGNNGTYTIVARNIGSAATSGTITVRDTLPTGLSFVSSTGAAWTISQLGPVITATSAGPIVAGDSSSFSITVAVAASAVPSVTNSATVSGGGDSSPANNRDSDPTAVAGIPDLTIDKRHTAPFSVGNNGTYTLVTTNVGSGATAGTITVRDTLPAGLTIVSGTGAGWTISNAAQIVTATNAGPVLAGDSTSFTITVSVAAAAVPSVTNSATVSGGGDATPANNRDSDPTAVAGAVDLTIDKRHTVAFSVGSSGTYTIVARNIGSAATSGTITVRDTLPTGLSFVNSTGAAWTISQLGPVITATSAGPIVAGDSSWFTITVAIAASAVPSVTNSATISGGGDASPANNRDSDPTAVAGVPDLTIDKRHTAAFSVGNNGTYTLVTTNVGSGATSGTITVRDTLPAGLTFVSGTGTGWTISNAAQIVTATNAGPVVAGDSASFALTVSVGAAAVPTVTNSATVSGGGDVSPANNRDSDPTAVAGAVDLTIDKRHTVAFSVGNNGTYTIVARNIGSAATSGTITVRDTLPTGLSFVSSTGAAWTISQLGPVITATSAGPIVAGDSSSFTITVAVAASAVPSVTNSATISGGGDASPANNRDSDPTAVAGIPDLTIDKRHTAAFSVGNNGTYTLVTTNVGSGATAGTITVRDTLPAGLTFVSGTGAGWTISNAAQIVTATSAGPVLAGDSTSFTLTVAVAAAAVPTVTNSATVSGGGDVSPANNRDSDPTAVAGAVDLTIDKRHTVAFSVGSSGTYTIVARNIGSAATSGTITVRDTLPTGLSFVSSTGAAWTISQLGPVITATSAGPIVAGDSSSFTITVAVAAPAVPSVTNSATISGGGDTSPANNRDSDPTAVAGVPDLTIDKRHTAAFSVGNNGTYTLVTTNVGSGATSGTITVRDTLPAGLTFVSGSGSGWTITNAAQIVTATNAGPVLAGDSTSFTITLSVGAAAVPSVTNSATVSGGGDVSPANNRDSDPTAVAGIPDLTIDKRHTAAFTVGNNGTYTLVARNIGSGATSGTITVRDTLPTGLTFVSGTGTGWTVSNAAQIVTATNAGPIVAGDSASFTLTVAVGASAVPSVTNSATVSGGGDVSPANNRDSDPTAVAGVPDLTIDKRHTANFTVGSNGLYTLVVTNVGSAATSGTITVRDTLPNGLSFVSSTGAAWTISQLGPVVTATTAGPIAIGDSSSFTLTVAVAAAAIPSVTNSATVSGGGDVSPANNRDSDPTAAATPQPDLTIDKRHTSAFVVGSNNDYTFVIRNVGSQPTTGTITVRDTLPNGLSFVGSTGAAWTVSQFGPVVTATTAGPIAAGDSSIFTMTVGVGAAAVPSVTNSATVSGGGDISPANNRDSDPTAVTTPQPDLTLDKRHTTTLTVGSNATYTLVATNVGTLPTSGTITVRDTLPNGLSFVSGAGAAWTVSQLGPVVTATSAGPIAVGDSSSFTITVAVGAAAAPSVTNSATVSGGGDVTPANNRDSDPGAVITPLPDLTLDKRHSANFTVGANGTFTLVTTNVGTGATSGTITVRDTLPAGLTFVSGTGTGWTVSNAAQIVTATNAGPIAAGDSAGFTLTVAVGAAAVPAVTNNATVSGGGDTTPGNDRDSDPVVVAGVPDLTLDKRHTAAFASGANGVYALVATNVGSGVTSGTITVRDTLPAGLTFVSGTGTGWTVSNAAQIVTANHVGAILAGDSASFTLTVAVGLAAVPSVTNNATVSGGGDITPGNNRDSDPTTVAGPAPDLALDKRHTQAFTVGLNATYTLVTRNVGAGATSGTITVRDTLPTGLTFVSGAGAGWTVSQLGPVVTATNAGPIVAGDSASFTITVAVGAAASPAVTNSATVSGGGDVTPANNRDSDPAVVGTPQPDLTLDKRHTSAFTVGGTGAYRLVATNVGQAATSGAITVRDTLPTGLTFVSGTGAGWTVSNSAQVVTATNAGPIAAGDSAAFTLTVSVAAAALPGVTNSATVSGGGDTTPGNNRDSDPTAVAGVVDFALVKSAASPFNVGSTATWRLSAHNVGSTASSGTITVRDTLPAGLTYVSGAGTGWTVGNAGTIVTATRNTAIAAGDSAFFTLDVTVGAAALPSVTNFASISGGGDSNPANDRGTASAPVVAQPDLALDKRHTAAFVAGNNATYTLVATNIGLVATSGAITVRDTLPAGLTFVSGAGSGWTVSNAAQIVTATNAGPIAAGDSSQFALTVAVGNAARPSVTNRATISGGGDTTPGNDQDTDPAIVTGGPNVTLSKIHVTPFAVGQPGTWHLVVRNTGTSSTTGPVSVRDSLPAGVTYTSANGAGWTFGASGSIVTAQYAGTLAAGDSATFDLHVNVSPTAPAGMVNHAIAATPGDTDPIDDTASDPTTVAGGLTYALTVQKHASPAQVELGGVVDYAVQVSNTGSGAADSTNVLDHLPAGFRYQNGTARLDGAVLGDPSGAPGPQLAFAIGTVPGGSTRTLTYRVVVGAGAGLGDGINSAYAVAPAPGGSTFASAVSTARVAILGGAFADAGIIAGKIYTDCDCASNGRQGPEELGIPGVRVVLEDGSAAITDAEGKYSFQNVAPRLHVVRVDGATLPEGARLAATTSRDAGQANSRFVDLHAGELHRVDFREISRDDAVMDRVLARRRTGEVSQADAAAPPHGARLEGADSAVTARPSLLVTGLIDARLTQRSNTDAALDGRSRDGFEAALQDVQSSSDGGKQSEAARGALFVQGTLGTGATVTGRYDTENDREHRLFRDLRPFEGYDVLGDASVHEWNAQSDSRLYLRVDQGASFAQFGDFTTPMRTAQRLGAFQRSMTGGLAQFGGGNLRVSGFATEGRSRQVIDELQGMGISGPYTLSRTDGTFGSEQVEIVTRDRNQPSRILSRQALVRFADYTIEPYTGRLVFKHPVPSLDSDLNPVSVRVTYEAEGAGDSFWTYGANATLSPLHALAIGATATRDEDPARPGNLASIDATLTPAPGVQLTAEFARSDSGTTFLDGAAHGQAWRSELALQGSRLDGRLFTSRIDRTFDNTSSGMSPGREESGGQLRFHTGAHGSLFANGIRIEDLASKGRRDGIEVGLAHTLGSVLSAEAAYRWAEETVVPASPLTSGVTPNQTSSVRGRLSAQWPGARRVGLFGELEQDLKESDQQRWAFGADAALTAKTRLYARHENIASFAGPFALNGTQQLGQTVVGLSSDAVRDGQVFTEYRARDAFAGRDAQAAFGLRNRWEASPGLHLDASLEHVEPLAGADSTSRFAKATSVTGGIEWTHDPLWKGTARLEFRDASSREQWLASAGASRKLSRDFAALGRGTWMLVPDEDRQDRRTQLGLAYRQTDANVWNALARWENRFEKAGPAGLTSVNRSANIFAAHVNMKPSAHWTLSALGAQQWMTDASSGLSTKTTTQLLGGRALVDLGSRFDAGVTGRTLNDANDQRRFGFGGEVGVMLTRGMRAGLGYNVFGFKDGGLGVDQTDRGPYLQLGVKFDEASLGLVRK